jgi:hypothetical protein
MTGSKKDLEELLPMLDDCIDDYHRYDNLSMDQLMDLHRRITTINYYLATKKVEAYKDWNECVKTLTKLDGNGKKMPYNRASNEADLKHPELYMLRTIIKESTAIAEGIRSNISQLKAQIQNGVRQN